ncbi:MAG: DUF5131 family protein [Candidatus Peribacteraceae bacterium]|nr:DUF5131 family protein [Candidatus Peribacteraceae bacterium]
MAERTGIEWADATWNPWMGCTKVSEGCKNCYMFRDMKRYGKDPTRVVRSLTTFKAPLKWLNDGKVPAGAKIFTCSWSDFFHPDADPWRQEAWDIIGRTPEFTYLILTKRPERIAAHLPKNWGEGWPNVWLGVSAENQDRADERLFLLMNTPARVRFVSAEPLLGPIDFTRVAVGKRFVDGKWEAERYNAFQDRVLFTDEGDVELGRIHWVITGGESDFQAPRPFNPGWVADIAEECRRHGTALFHKQNGGTRKVDGAWGGREVIGMVYSEFPR